MKAVVCDIGNALSSAQPTELALVAELGNALRRCCQLEAFDDAMEHLRKKTQADACELFLAAPGAHEVFLVSHQGQDIEAFCIRDRFVAGEGFPGMALSYGATLVSETLTGEMDFLRSRVKRLGYSTVVCAPLGPETEVPGSVLLAWKQAPEDMAAVLRLITIAAAAVGNATDLMHAQLRVRQLRRLTLLEVDNESDPSDCPDLHVVDTGRHTHSCPAQLSSEVQIHGGRMGWPVACMEAGCTASARYCIPLQQDSHVWAVATVAFNESSPLPHTRHLPIALWRTEDIAPLGSTSATETPLASHCQPHSSAAASSRLQIHCFGGLSVSVEGRPLAEPDMKRRKAWELLAILAASAGRPQTVESLVSRLWPDIPLVTGRNRFHVTLSALRTAIEPEGGDVLPHLKRDAARYCLDTDSSLSVDLWQFGRLLREAAAARSIELARPLLEGALSLYSGEAFGGDFTSDWSDAIAQRYRNQALRAVADLAEMNLRCGQVSAALSTLSRADDISASESRSDPRLLMLRATCMQRQAALRDT